MDNPTENNCYCFDCCFVKDELLQKMIYKHYLPVDPSCVIDSIYTTHIISKATFTPNSVLCALIHIYEGSTKKCITLIIKLPKNQNSLEAQNKAQNLFNNEVQFYNTESFARCVLFRTCYLANIANEIFHRPVIVLDDLIGSGYTIHVAKLDERMLHKYMRILGLFHAKTFKMQANTPDNYRYLLENMRLESEDQVKIKQEQAASAFLNELLTNDIYDNIKVKEEIIEKLKKVKHLEMCTLSIIIHGCFTRNAVALKIEDSTCMKIIDFQKIKIGSPVIDFGLLLLSNLPNKRSILHLETFFFNAMDKYVEGIKEEYPEMNVETLKLLKREIYDNLLFSYINLGIVERYTIPQKIWLLHVLNQFCEY